MKRNVWGYSKSKIKESRFSKFSLMLVLGMLYAVLSGCYGEDELHVKVKSGGWVQGKWHEETPGNAREFLGIPYAKAPVGELRFAAPKPASHWIGTLDATEHGPSCIQNPGALSATGELSEDCLTLNVYTPTSYTVSENKKTGKQKLRKNDHLPVMVWIHGGAFVAGGSNQYDGWRLAQERNVVVVTLNYRLGALGFFSHPELDDSSTKMLSGNAGLLDQQLALKWVQTNIKAFGGDPKNVTLFGESAGSMSVCTQMVAPGSQNLAHQFILESAVCVGGLPIKTKEQSDQTGQDLAQAFCADAEDPIACLREQPAEELFAWGADQGISGAGWSPTIIPNSSVLPASPKELISEGKYNKGPVIVGTNKFEWSLFQQIGQGDTVASVAEYEAYLNDTYGPLASVLLSLYPAPSDELANLALASIATDQAFRCPTRTFARMTSAMGSSVWLYSFDLLPAIHAQEIGYVFGNPTSLAPELNEPVRETMQSYWTTFAKSGNPNVEGQPEWPNYEQGGDQHMIINEVSEASAGLQQAQCDFWDNLATQQQP